TPDPSVGVVVVTITVGASSTLECTPATTGSGQPVMRCTATAPGGLRSLKVTDSTAGHAFTASSGQACSSGLSTGTIQFPTFANDRYKVVVTDCQRPGAQDIYQVRPDGTATLIRAVG
ncbi:MAG: hypothetical protein M3011_11095, partial [Actinomycetota bacterium]|nr:hypothetical protein [Actinomycetota bacterium]